ncbi:hypothetical protein BGZ90_007360, partial [Linnemannia elongata]
MADNLLTLFCLVDGEATTNAFPVEIESTETISDLKKLIRTEKSPEFDDIAADKLTIWRVSIPDKDDGETPDTFRVVVQRPPPVAKRDREEDAGLFSMRKRHRPYTLMDAIEDAGLAEVAVVDGESNLSRLDNKQRVVLLGCIGQKVDRTDAFYSLSSTAREFQGTNVKDMDKISAPHGTKLPVVNTKELYVRKAYKDLHQTIIDTFDNDRNEVQKHVVVT